MTPTARPSFALSKPIRIDSWRNFFHAFGKYSILKYERSSAHCPCYEHEGSMKLSFHENKCFISVMKGFIATMIWHDMTSNLFDARPTPTVNRYVTSPWSCAYSSPCLGGLLDPETLLEATGLIHRKTAYERLDMSHPNLQWL